MIILSLTLGLLALVLGVVSGTIVMMLILPYLPGAVDRLSNKPNRYRPQNGVVNPKEMYPVSAFGFFTTIAQGQVKIIVAGEDFIRCIMKYDGHTFKGYALEYLHQHGVEDQPLLTRDSPEYWDIVCTTKEAQEEDKRVGENEFVPELFEGVPSAHPLMHRSRNRSLVSDFITWWEQRVFKITGYVFTGVYPFRKVRTYRMTRNDEEGTKVDYSDHFRVQDFEFPVHVPKSDTNDKIQVSVEVTLIARVFNAFLTAFHTDNWSSRLTGATKDCVTSYTRPRPLDIVLSAKSEEAKEESIKKEADSLVKEILTIDDEKKPHDTALNYGIRVTGVLIKDISVIDPETEKRLQEEALARVDKKAAIERAIGEAATLEKQIEVVSKAGHVGLAVLSAEANIRTARAAGEKGLVVVGSGRSGSDPIQMAMLHALRTKPQAEKEVK